MNELISIIAVCATFMIGIIGFIVNTFMQRKNNSIKVITGHRLERRKRMQSLIAELLMNSDPFLLNMLTNDELKREIVGKLTASANEFRTLFMFHVEADRKFIQQVYQFRELVCEYIINGSTDSENLLSAREELAKTCDIYSSTDWKRIKLETVGHQKNMAIKSWMDIYSSYQNNFPKEKADNLSQNNKIK